MLVEVCANSLESALHAERAGADRIELCSELAVGGITPSYGLLKEISSKISIPVRVLIRPRSGDFTYSDEEFEIMKRNVELCSQIGFEGVVTGVLFKDFTLDFDRTQQLMSAAKGLKFTFHRAFDWIANPFEALLKLEEIGIDALLTSGQEKKAETGIGLLKKLNDSLTKITIMPGSGVNVTNALLFKEKGFKAIHLSGVKMEQKLQQEPKLSMLSEHMLSDTCLPLSNFEILKEVVKMAK